MTNNLAPQGGLLFIFKEATELIILIGFRTLETTKPYFKGINNVVPSSIKIQIISCIDILNEIGLGIKIITCKQ